MTRILLRIPSALAAAVALLAPALGQQNSEVPPVRLYVPLDRALAFQMTSKKALKSFQLAKEGLVKAGLVEGNPNAILVHGLAVGDTLLTLQDVAGKTERYELVVRRELLLPLGGTFRLALASKQPIGKALSGGVKVVRIRTIPDEPKAVEIEGVSAGACLVTLTDNEGKKEDIRVDVRKVHLLFEVGEIKKLQMASKAVIDTVALEGTGIVDVMQTAGENFVELKGLAPGVVRVFLADKAKKIETFDVGVKAKKE